MSPTEWIVDALSAVAGFLWAHGTAVVPLLFAVAALVVLARIGHLVALAYADLRLRWRAGTALGRGGVVDRYVDASLVSGDPLAHGRGEHSLFYRVYLQSDAWRQRRRRTLMLAGRACQQCGAARATDAHHLSYDRLGQELDTDLLAVCGACHRALHARSRVA